MRRKIYLLLYVIVLLSCGKIRDINQEPEMVSIQQGLKTSAVVGYCASLAINAFQSFQMPDNVVLSLNNAEGYFNSWTMIVRINTDFPLQFCSETGYFFVSGAGDHNGGIISILFSDVDILEGEVQLGGIKTIPVMLQNDGSILTLFAAEDIIIGPAGDTILNLPTGLSVFKNEIRRLESAVPENILTAVNRNVWYISIDQSGTSINIYDDEFTINGGGQVAEVKSITGGNIGHAMINTRFGYELCPSNPYSGKALSQNMASGDIIVFDVRYIVGGSHDHCYGKMVIENASGKYLSYSGKEIILGL